MLKDALYYPHIGLKNVPLVKSMALLYDRVYRIVPDNVIPDDHPDLQPLLEDGLVGAMIDPTRYSRAASDNFLAKLGDWRAAALSHQEEDAEQISRLHVDKTDQRVREMFSEMGCSDENEWMHVPTELASNFMLYLATEISKKNNLSLITNNWGAWTGANYFRLNGKLDETISCETKLDHLYDPYSLFGLILSEMIPMNISDISSDEIVSFRGKRHDEISCFRNAITALSEELKALDSDEIKIDRIRDKVRELNRAKKDYKHSADLIGAKRWFGVSMMGFPAPIVFGNLMSIPAGSTIALGAAGLAIGALYSITSTREDIRKLNAENPASYFIELGRSFKNYTQARGSGDINFQAWSCMEEYVND